MRDTVFSGNQEVYEAIGEVFVFLASIAIPVGGFLKALGTGAKLSLPVVGKIVGLVVREIAEDKLSSIVGLGAVQNTLGPASTMGGRARGLHNLPFNA